MRFLIPTICVFASFYAGLFLGGFLRDGKLQDAYEAGLRDACEAGKRRARREASLGAAADLDELERGA